MATLTVRDLDDAIVAKLEQRAARNHRSVERRSATELLATADRIAAMTPKDVDQTDSTELLRASRYPQGPSRPLS